MNALDKFENKFKYGNKVDIDDVLALIAEMKEELERQEGIMAELQSQLAAYEDRHSRGYK
jgi:tetrahydromethanopterin S-methyltransferase subunit A